MTYFYAAAAVEAAAPAKSAESAMGGLAEADKSLEAAAMAALGLVSDTGDSWLDNEDAWRAAAADLQRDEAEDDAFGGGALEEEETPRFGRSFLKTWRRQLKQSQKTKAKGRSMKKTCFAKYLDGITIPLGDDGISRSIQSGKHEATMN